MGEWGQKNLAMVVTAVLAEGLPAIIMMILSAPTMLEETGEATEAMEHPGVSTKVETDKVRPHENLVHLWDHSIREVAEEDRE